MKIEVRDEQHNESTTCAFTYDAPSAAIRRPSSSDACYGATRPFLLMSF